MSEHNNEKPGKEQKLYQKAALKVKKGDYHVHIYLEEARGLLGEDQR